MGPGGETGAVLVSSVSMFFWNGDLAEAGITLANGEVNVALPVGPFGGTPEGLLFGLRNSYNTFELTTVELPDPVALQARTPQTVAPSGGTLGTRSYWGGTIPSLASKSDGQLCYASISVAYGGRDSLCFDPVSLAANTSGEMPVSPYERASTQVFDTELVDDTFTAVSNLPGASVMLVDVDGDNRLFVFDGSHRPYMLGPIDPNRRDEIEEDDNPPAVVNGGRHLCFKHSGRLPEDEEMIMYDLHTHNWTVSDITPGDDTYTFGMFAAFDRYCIFQAEHPTSGGEWFYWDSMDREAGPQLLESFSGSDGVYLNVLDKGKIATTETSSTWSIVYNSYDDDKEWVVVLERQGDGSLALTHSAAISDAEFSLAVPLPGSDLTVLAYTGGNPQKLRVLNSTMGGGELVNITVPSGMEVDEISGYNSTHLAALMTNSTNNGATEMVCIINVATGACDLQLGPVLGDSATRLTAVHNGYICLQTSVDSSHTYSRDLACWPGHGNRIIAIDVVPEGPVEDWQEVEGIMGRFDEQEGVIASMKHPIYDEGLFFVQLIAPSPSPSPTPSSSPTPSATPSTSTSPSNSPTPSTSPSPSIPSPSTSALPTAAASTVPRGRR